MPEKEKSGFLIRTARKAIELHIKEGKKIKIESREDWLDEKRGIFVTLKTYPSGQLRGCIGFIEPVYALKDGLVNAAISAATGDPRFPPLSINELDKITVEISILTKPELIEGNIPDEIKPFEDGLILEKGSCSGVFLPQVWEQIPEKEEFLGSLCLKAGLDNPLAWKEKDSKIYRFKVHAFEEEKPNGAVIEKKLNPSRS